MSEHCFFFDDTATVFTNDKSASPLSNATVGSKSAAFHSLISLGIKNIPEGFAVTASEYNDELWASIESSVKNLEAKTELALGSAEKPLFLIVRRGEHQQGPEAVFSIGLNDETLNYIQQTTGNSRNSIDFYVNFIETFSTAMKIEGADALQGVRAALREEKGYSSDAEFTEEDLQQLLEKFKESVPQFPQEPLEQLRLAVRSFIAEGASPFLIQRLINGKIGEQCGAGDCTFRSPQTGEARSEGHYAAAGTSAGVAENAEAFSRLEESMADNFAKLQELSSLLEKEFKAIVEINFVVENGELFIVGITEQKMSPLANIKLAFDLASEDKITHESAVAMVSETSIIELLKEHFDEAELEGASKFVTGKCSAEGEATGSVYFDLQKAKEAAADGNDVIIWRPSFTEEDLPAISVAKGIFSTEDCDMSMCQKLGIPAVVACSGVEYDKEEETLKSGETELHEGDPLSIYGAKGYVLMDKVATTSANVEDMQELLDLLNWADEICASPRARPNGRGLSVLASVNNADDADKARGYGAAGVGLCNLSEMFGDEREETVRKLLTTTDEEEKEGAVSDLEEGIAGDLAGIIETMTGFPIKIRLLDANLQSFFPDGPELAEEVASMKERGRLEGDLDEDEYKEKRALYDKVKSLTEVNPFIGNHGARVAIANQQLLTIQIHAIANAVCTAKENDLDPRVEIIVPFVCSENELEQIKPVFEKIVNDTLKEREQTKVHISFGCSIDIPRAALITDKLAQYANTMVIDADSLTQLCFGLTKEAAERTYLPYYKVHGIMKQSPFKTLDRSVENLVKKAVENGREESKSAVFGISGEQLGDPAVIRLCHTLGMNYVSCNPSDVLVARLVAAKAVLEHKE